MESIKNRQTDIKKLREQRKAEKRARKELAKTKNTSNIILSKPDENGTSNNTETILLPMPKKNILKN